MVFDSLQRKTDSAAHQSLAVAVQAEAVDAERPLGTIGIGRPVQIRTGGEVFQAWVDVSRYTHASGPTNQRGEEYILQACAVRSKYA
jgi:hypothetical protein